MNSRGATFVDWLPDGGMLIATRFGDAEQLHRVAMPLGMREQLTFYREPVTVARSPQSAVAPGFVFLQATSAATRSRRSSITTSNTRAVRMLSDGKGLHGGLDLEPRRPPRGLSRHRPRRRELRPVRRGAG